MDKEKTRLEKAGWKFGDAADFLGMSKEEQRCIDIQIALGQLIREARTQKELSQPQLTEFINSNQSRVSKMEAGKPTVSIDLQVRTLLALDVSGETIAWALSDSGSEVDALYEDTPRHEKSATRGLFG